MQRWLKLSLVVAMAGCNVMPTESQSPIRTGDVLRVLFIGNSLTYWNDLPAIVEALADSANVKGLAWRMVAYPDFALEDHWAQGDALEAISAGWDIVVLQQGPSSTPANRANLIEWTRRFSTRIRGANGRPALFAPWPQVVNLSTLNESSISYQLAADSVDGLLLPVSQAWRLAWQEDPSAPLYSGDGLHPSASGSYLAALVIFQRLYNRSPIGLPACVSLRLTGSPQIGVTPALAGTLQRAAAAATAAPAAQRAAVSAAGR
ncbi:MAG: hypothetical protein WEE89_21395 [Gemmatimonadota bacterium]